MDKRIGAGVGLLLAMEVLNSYQLVLPPLYSEEEITAQQIRQAARFIAVYIMLIAFISGALTQSPYTVLLPAIAIGLVYLFYMYEAGRRSETAVMVGEDEEE